MAHSNPEFALGLQRREPTPVSQLADIRDPVTIRDLHRRMAAIQRKIDRLCQRGKDRSPIDPVCVLKYLHPDDARAWTAWQTGLRRIMQREVADRTTPQLPEPAPGPGMHGGSKLGERFCPPKLRVPADVQAGRCKVRRGTLAR